MRDMAIVKEIIENKPMEYKTVIKCWKSLWYHKTYDKQPLWNALDVLGITENEFYVCRARYGL